MQTLRARLVISHLLPVLIIVPIVGIGLIYVLESQVLLPGFLRAYLGNSALVAEISQDQYRIWTDPVYAQTILARVSARLQARIMFINSDGLLMASSDPNDLPNLTKPVINDALLPSLGGKVVWQIYYRSRLQGEAFDIWEPVIDNRFGDVIGVVRTTYSFTDIAEQFVQLRSLVFLVSLVALVVGGLIGLLLAISIIRPMQRVTSSVNSLARGERTELLRESRLEELRSLEGAVNFLVERLHGLETARRQLLANLVHELGRPLGALRSAVQALMKGAKRDPKLSDELLTGMESELVRLQHLMADLTRLYDQALGSLELNREPVDLNVWLPAVLAPWEAQAREKGLAFQKSIPSGLPVLSIDPNRVGQALGNLLSNAVKFTPPGEKVDVTAQIDESEVRIEVSDGGPGIPLEERDQLFTPFYRGSQGRRFTEGMGLGLSIAKDLVTAHGGRIAFRPGEPHGSVFSLILPKG